MIRFGVKNLSFKYDEKNVLENINFDFDDNDFVAIIGPNGGGKSTFLKLVLGLLKPSSGEINLSCKIKDIGYVPQIFNTNSNFNARVIDVVLMAFLDKKRWFFYSKEDRQKASKALEMVGMSGYEDYQINNLSGGQKQRVFIARALAGDVKCLLLDEPTASIDIKGQVEIFDLLKNLHEEHKKGIMVVCHDASIVLAYADIIAYINKKIHIHKNDKTKQNQGLKQHLTKDLFHLCEVELMTNICGCEDRVLKNIRQVK